ncbi:hypothetical protein B0H13DRAFT_2369536 [Mycena leptocephala]|nr:hypothetical protein B0H13DRAFT_2369536 [Mycena leptocephala]
MSDISKGFPRSDHPALFSNAVAATIPTATGSVSRAADGAIAVPAQSIALRSRHDDTATGSVLFAALRLAAHASAGCTVERRAQTYTDVHARFRLLALLTPAPSPSVTLLRTRRRLVLALLHEVRLRAARVYSKATSASTSAVVSRPACTSSACGRACASLLLCAEAVRVCAQDPFKRIAHAREGVLALRRSALSLRAVRYFAPQWIPIRIPSPYLLIYASILLLSS